MATDYGTDVSCFPDLDPFFRLQSGVRVLAEALVKRITTAFLFYSESYGTDIRDLLSAKMSEQRVFTLRNVIQAQWLMDERVLSAQVRIDFNAQTRVLRITGTVEAADGPFTLVADVSDAGAHLVGISEAA